MRTRPQTLAALLIGALVGSMIAERCTRHRQPPARVVVRPPRCQVVEVVEEEAGEEVPMLWLRPAPAQNLGPDAPDMQEVTR